ncbi:UvrD-helicase domain-containing protein [Myxococcus vastator]|uniref:UvrD-helicase domain-containing protein n=1 Tax=Myxococcus vastator TaxID=2709664 RepID=UPI0013D4A862|nr:ATP-dependent helicase [Myxococcus vastator]
MAPIAPETWSPRGILDLEPNAWTALRRIQSSCVVAGPGAGKSEFLAQRASYLLETGLCMEPYRILAISFKSDAAENLAARVRQRCAPGQARRFVSLTFDAFTKNLLDRFMPAVPNGWRPSRPYEVTFSNRRQIDDFLERTRLDAPRKWQTEVAGLTQSTFESRVLGTLRLPIQATTPVSGTEFAIQRWWQENLRQDTTSLLTFAMINRLAELLLRANPQICRALRTTYPFVFVDEFQDTTYAQYDFLLSAFGDPRISVTAVGDDKQRIMAWAGARPDSFRKFESDFRANRIPLLFNFRSSEGLVRIQHVVAQALDSGTIPAIAKAESKVDGDVAQVWKCPSEVVEAEQIANWLKQDLSQRNTTARDYAILVRQTADRFEDQFQESFSSIGLRVRNESRSLGRTTLQDLLVEELTTIGISLLRLGNKRKDPKAWEIASTAILRIRGVDVDDDADCDRAEKRLIEFLQTLRAVMRINPPDEAVAQDLVGRILEFLSPAALARTYLEYSTGESLAIAVEAFRIHLSDCAVGAADWSVCLDRFEGVGEIPLMTVHKSKGLEYDTVFFVGLDDKMWWSHSAGNPEGIATFFVALSRARQRAIFTFCRARGARQKVADLYQLLTDAGVPEVAI